MRRGVESAARARRQRGGIRETLKEVTSTTRACTCAMTSRAGGEAELRLARLSKTP